MTIDKYVTGLTENVDVLLFHDYDDHRHEDKQKVDNINLDT